VVTIRPAGPGDVDALHEIAAADYEKYVPRVVRPKETLVR
jgi:hypothetical protein